MEDTDFAKRIRFGRLYDFYGGLLTDKQKNIMEFYFYDDYSLAEIAAKENTTRQAVYDLLKRVEQTLEKYEEKLKLLERDESQHFEVRAAAKLLKTYILEGHEDPRLKETLKILQDIEEKGR
jgi:predicted DNA-binding protein YlxM (UPF0122 family)